MNSEKVKEIKELLRCMNGEKACTNCYINEVAQEQETCCINVVADMALDLINDLERENERLSNTEIGELIKENEELAKQCVEWSELDFKKRNKIKELKDRIAELENIGLNENITIGEYLQEMQRLKDRVAELEEDKEKWQRKAVNYYEMAKSYGVECIIDNDIDETLKEFIND